MCHFRHVPFQIADVCADLLISKIFYMRFSNSSKFAIPVVPFEGINIDKDLNVLCL